MSGGRAGFRTLHDTPWGIRGNAIVVGKDFILAKLNRNENSLADLQSVAESRTAGPPS